MISSLTRLEEEPDITQQPPDRCDGCRRIEHEVGIVNRLDGGGGYLCAACWQREMARRQTRNAEGSKHPYAIEAWPEDFADNPA